MLHEISVYSWDIYQKICPCLKVKMDMLAIVDRWDQIIQDRDKKIERKRLRNPRREPQEYKGKEFNYHNLTNAEVRAAFLLDAMSKQQLYKWIALNFINLNTQQLQEELVRTAYNDLCSNLGFDPFKPANQQLPQYKKQSTPSIILKQETQRTVKFTDILLEGDEEELQQKSKVEQKLQTIETSNSPEKSPKKQMKKEIEATKGLCLPQIYKKWGGWQKLSFQNLTFLKYQHQRNLQILNPVFGSQMAKIAEEEDLENKQEPNEEAIDFSDQLYKTVDSSNIQQLTELSEQEPQEVDKQKYLEVLSKFLNQNKQAINKLKKYQIDLKNQPQDQLLEEEYELQIEDLEQKQQNPTKLQKMKFKIEDQNEQFQFQPDEQLMEEQFMVNRFEDEEEQWRGLQNPLNINIQQQNQEEQKNEQEEIQKSQIINKIRKQIKNMRRLQKFQQMKKSDPESANVDLQKNLIDENLTISQEKLQQQKAQYLKETQLMFQKILQQKQTINLQEKDKEQQEHQIVQSEESQQEMENKSLQEAEQYILQKKENLQNQYDQILQRKLQKKRPVSPYSKKKVSFDENFEQKHISQQKEEQQEEQKDPLADIQLPGKFRYQDIYSLAQQVKSQKQTTQFKEFELNTEKRAQERQQEELQDLSQQQSKFVFKKNLMIKTTQKKKKQTQQKTKKQTSQKEILQKQVKSQKEQQKEVRDISSLQEENQKPLTVQQQQGNQETKLETFGEVQQDLEEKSIEKISEQILQQPDQTLITFENVSKTEAQQQSVQVQQHMQFNPVVKSVQSLYQEIDQDSQIQYHKTKQTTEQTKPSYQVFKQFPRMQSEQNVQERQVTPLRVEQSDVMIKQAEIWNLQELEIKQRQQEQIEENQLVILEQRKSKGAIQIAKSNENLEQQENTVKESQERKAHSQQIKRKKKQSGSQENLQIKAGQQKRL